MNYPKVDIIILNWNGLTDTTECIQSLTNINYPNYNILIVDNASQGNDVEVLQERFGSFVTIIKNSNNYGCSGGYNSGIRYALLNTKPEYILLMNNDIIVHPDFLTELVKTADSNQQVSIVSPKQYYYDYKGRKDIIWNVGGCTRWWCPIMYRQIGCGAEDSAKYQTMQKMEWVSGAIMLVRSTSLTPGPLFNEWYFFGFEDIEFCLRMRRKGYDIVFEPSAKVWHKVRISARKAGLTYFSSSGYYYSIRNNYPLAIYLFHLLLFPLVQSFWILLHITKYRRSMKNYFTELKNFFLGKPQNPLYKDISKFTKY